MAREVGEEIIKIPNGSVRFQTEDGTVSSIRICNRFGDGDREIAVPVECRPTLTKLLNILVFGVGRDDDD